MNSAAVYTLGALLALPLLWMITARQLRDANRLSLVAMLGAIACVINVVVPLPNFEMTMPIVLCVAITWGAQQAIAVAFVATIGTDAVSGIGVWTAWQLLAFSLCAVCAQICLSSVKQSQVRRTLLLVLGAFLTVGFDIVTTLGGMYSSALIAESSMGHALVVGIPYTALHVVGVVVALWLVGDALLQMLERAGRKLLVVVVETQ